MGDSPSPLTKGLSARAARRALRLPMPFCMAWPGGGHGHGVQPPALFGGQRLPVVQGVCQPQHVGVLGQRRNCDIGKTRVTALRHGGIGNLPREPGGACVQRQDAICIGGQRPVQPAVKPVGALIAPGLCV